MLYRNLPKDQNPPDKTAYLDADAKANLPLIAAMMKAIVDGDLYRKAYKVAVMKELDEYAHTPGREGASGWAAITGGVPRCVELPNRYR